MKDDALNGFWIVILALILAGYGCGDGLQASDPSCPYVVPSPSPSPVACDKHHCEKRGRHETR